MAKKEHGAVKKSQANTSKTTPRSVEIAERGIKTGPDFADLMSALMSDLICGAITPDIGNATCNAGGKLLKIVEMQYKYGKPNSAGTTSLKLTGN